MITIDGRAYTKVAVTELVGRYNVYLMPASNIEQEECVLADASREKALLATIILKSIVEDETKQVEISTLYNTII